MLTCLDSHYNMGLYIDFLGRKIAILTDAVDHEINIRNVTFISVGGTPLAKLLEALNRKQVNLCNYELFILILGYNDMELDRHFFEMYYKHILDSLQLQSPFARFVISNLVTDVGLYKKAVHVKNGTIKMINGLSSRIFLFNMWKKFVSHGMIQPEFIRKNKLTPMGAHLMIKFLGHKIAGEVDLW